MKNECPPVGLRIAMILFAFMAPHAIAENENRTDLNKLSKMPASKFTKILDGSASPDKRFAVAIGSKDGSEPEWQKLDLGDGKTSHTMDDEKAAAYLVDLKSDRVASILEMQHFGTGNTYNHESALVFWSPDSRWLMEEQNWKWSTGISAVHRISPKGDIEADLDLLAVAKKLVADSLLKQSPALTEEQRGAYSVTIHGAGITNEGVVSAEIMAYVPKDEDSEYIHLSMVAKVSKDGASKLSVLINKATPFKE